MMPEDFQDDALAMNGISRLVFHSVQRKYKSTYPIHSQCIGIVCTLKLLIGSYSFVILVFGIFIRNILYEFL